MGPKLASTYRIFNVQLLYMEGLCIPQNDVDCFYNADWKKNTKHPAGSFIDAQLKINKQLSQYINDLPEDTTNPISVFKQSYTNRNEKLSTIINIIGHVNNIKNINDMVSVITKLYNYGISTFLSLWIDCPPRFPKLYTVGITGPKLTLQNKYSYLDTQYYVNINYLEDCLRKIYDYGTDKLGMICTKKEFVNDVMLFETLVAKMSLDLEDEIDPNITDNYEYHDDFLHEYDSRGYLRSIFDTMKIDTDTMITYPNKKYLVLIKKIFDNYYDYFDMLKNYLLYSVIRSFGVYLPIGDIFLALVPKKIPGSQYIDMFYEYFGYHLDKYYNYIHDVKDDIPNIQDIFYNIRKYFIDSITRQKYFSDSFQTEAIRKLTDLKLIIGEQGYYPNMNDFPQLGYDFYQNLIRLESYYIRSSNSLIGKKVIHHWLSVNRSIHSFQVNAYNDATTNTIYIPSAIINVPFYDRYASPIYNYCGIGVIIAHEITHCLDKHGANYDHSGNLRNWWKDDDYKKFEEENDKIIEQYSHYDINGTKINSIAAVGENMADIIGIKSSLRAFINRYDINDLEICRRKKTIETFFKRYAELFREVTSDDYINHVLMTDVHSPSSVRINAPLTHIKEFHELYGTIPGHRNYLPEQSRVRFID